jgi:hypothetical protein
MLITGRKKSPLTAATRKERRLERKRLVEDRAH